MKTATMDERTARLILGGDPDAPATIPSDADFVDAGEEYLPAPELQEVASALIGGHAGLHAATHKRSIVYAWKRQGGGSRRVDKLGECLKFGQLPRFASHVDFAIWLAADHCRAYQLTQWQLEALLFHQLLHIGISDKLKAEVRGHDAELFLEELSRYGPWKADLRRTADAFAQLGLGLDGNGR